MILGHGPIMPKKAARTRLEGRWGGTLEPTIVLGELGHNAVFVGLRLGAIRVAGGIGFRRALSIKGRVGEGDGGGSGGSPYSGSSISP